MAFRCPCGSRFDGFARLAKHANETGHKVRCSCGRFFACENHLLQHQRDTNHADEESLDSRLRCWCERTFATSQGLQAHQNDTKHSYGPPCGTKDPRPQAHIVHTCGICERHFANEDGVRAHKAVKHPACPTCNTLFDTAEQRQSHQRLSGHCYCAEHDEYFGSREDFKCHQRGHEYLTAYECIECDRSFMTQRALNDHEASPGHAAVIEARRVAADTAIELAQNERENIRCEECRRTFKTIKGYDQHKTSLKHQPLSELVCPLSEKCKKNFTSPSALLLHLESDGCKSGMNRLKLNAIVHAHDTGRRITFEENASSVIGTASAAGADPTTADLATSFEALSIAEESTPLRKASTICKSTSMYSGVLVEDFSDTESINSGVLVHTPCYTPIHISEISTSHTDNLSSTNNPSSTANTPFTTTKTVKYNPSTKTWPCIIPGCQKSFPKRKRLEQHLYASPYHAPQLFHCPPTTFLGEEGGGGEGGGGEGGGDAREGGAKHKDNKIFSFKTLSGFAMHLESGNCLGGNDNDSDSRKEALERLVALFEKRVRAVVGSGIGVQLLT